MTHFAAIWLWIITINVLFAISETQKKQETLFLVVSCEHFIPITTWSWNWWAFWAFTRLPRPHTVKLQRVKVNKRLRLCHFEIRCEYKFVKWFFSQELAKQWSGKVVACDVNGKVDKVVETWKLWTRKRVVGVLCKLIFHHCHNKVPK